MTEHQSELQIRSTNKVNRYVNEALESMQRGFTSMASKKNALGLLNYAYELLTHDFIRNAILDKRDATLEMTPFWEDLYWKIPSNLHTWKDKIANEIVNALPDMKETVSKINDMAALRQEIKDSDVNRPQPKQISDFELRIHRTIKQEMEKMKSDYAYGIEMDKLFGGLSVQVNAHYVVNQFGTEFIRCFYYLNGRFTKLSVIIAVMQELADKKKAQLEA